MKIVILLFTTLARIMHTHTFACGLVWSCAQLVAEAMARESCHGAAAAPEQTTLTAQLLLAVTLTGTHRRLRERRWVFPILSASPVLAPGTMLHKTSNCFAFSKHGVSSLQRHSPTDWLQCLIPNRNLWVVGPYPVLRGQDAAQM